MSTTNEHKRRKYSDGEKNNNKKKSPDSASDVEESDSSADESSSGGDGSSHSPCPFVAWLEEDPKVGDNKSHNVVLSVGELHFSSAEHSIENCCDNIDGEDNSDNNAYCVVSQLKLVTNDDGEDEDDETPLVYTFKDSFPFRVIKSSSCIAGVPLMPIAADGTTVCDDLEMIISEDEEDYFNYSMDSELRSELVEELLSSSQQSNSNVNVVSSPNWKVSIPNANDQLVIDGVNAWWKAGEQKTGWDLAKVSKDDYTTLQTIHAEEGKKEGSSSDDNILMSLYKDLCALFQPLHITNNLTRDTIEERFEWRTYLCTNFAWAVPNEAAIQAIASLNQPILEIGAGTGYWAWLLTQRNVDIAAYDLVDSHDGEKHRFRHGLVQDGGVEQVSCEDHAGRTLMLCWPDIVGDEASTDADRGSFGVDTLKAYKGGTVIYVGELGPSVVRAAKGWGDPFPPGGSSSSAAFQEELHSQFVLETRVLLPNWPPYNSHLTIWRRKKEVESSP